jgi:hypothetical protein
MRNASKPPAFSWMPMTSSPAREQGHQLPLMRTLIKAGASATPHAIVMTLAHWELAPVEMLLENGLEMTAPIAAALGRDDRLADLLDAASPEDRQTALGLAVINRRFEAARLCLDAGADPNALLPVHAHSTPLHQAVLDDDIELKGRGPSVRLMRLRLRAPAASA